jgi:HAD superfamily phosphoserine phosphatase-like hydrolase
MKTHTKLALFDLDHTLIPIDSEQQWGLFLSKIGAVDSAYYAQQNESFYQDYKAGNLNIANFLKFGFAVLTQHSIARLLEIQQQFIAEVILKHILPQAKQLVADAKAQNMLCILVTATNSFVSLPIAQLFGFDAQHLIATEPNTKANIPWHQALSNNAGNVVDFPDFTGDVLGIPSFQQGKIQRIEAWLKQNNYHKNNFSEIYAYSDSHNDIPMLEWATHAIATNPDETLFTHAQKHHWPVMQLFGLNSATAH